MGRPRKSQTRPRTRGRGRARSPDDIEHLDPVERRGRGRKAFIDPNDPHQLLPPIQTPQVQVTPNNSRMVCLGQYGISREAVQSDMSMLLEEALKLPTCTEFPSFIQAWVDLQFHLIHFASMQKEDRELFMYSLYQSLLAHLSQDAFQTFSYPRKATRYQVDVVVLFSLYMLHQTQPKEFPLVPIRVDTDQWKRINSIYQECGEKQNLDAVYIFGKLKETNSFIFTAYVDHKLHKNSASVSQRTLQRIEPDPMTFDPDSVDRQLEEVEKNLATSTFGGLIDPEVHNSLVHLESDYDQIKTQVFSNIKLNKKKSTLENAKNWLLDRNSGGFVSDFVQNITEKHNQFKAQTLTKDQQQQGSSSQPQDLYSATNSFHI
ncbi:hypothetical protein CONCODRAFT_77378 [Conidiobolus coronatus NRRL 28638]|uniref:Uncharacterized protein n=1 Tax=Conidiobolus coronatus (strain ATCC 28846 / CBS 209.66 / NRRL 28638) TaxID=796925 RepID=A0A137PEQ1_CONC2|nr:hypothetical protein CONCODRAFT_77378 [Conidiobolus coronatus NRRL 28638]|eukprot:KXN73431.1 hypothetical protein CONCODRAFT_77378 [Conidiobolus coronatus NRRL 28638]